MQPALAFAAAHRDADVPLAALAARAGLSPFHLHRLFAAVAGETPKQFTLRLRLGRGAALLLGTDASVLDIALECGFQSHEAFTRAFRRQFRLTPRAYRARGFVGSAGRAEAAAHAEVVDRAGPCVGLYRMSLAGRPERGVMAYSVSRKDVAPQPVLVVRRRVPRAEIGPTIGAVLPLIFQYAQQRGLALSGHPFTRYPEFGAGLITMEPGIRVVGTAPAPPPDSSASAQASVESEVVESTLPGGPVASTVHEGPYDTLQDAYAALETWMASQGLTPAGAPWESYITDPTEHPDPKDWKTEICWPVK